MNNMAEQIVDITLEALKDRGALKGINHTEYAELRDDLIDLVSMRLVEEEWK